MLTLLATATLPAGPHPAGFRAPGSWRIAEPALARLDDVQALRLDRAALAGRLYTGLVFRAEVADTPAGVVAVPAGGRSIAVLRLSDTASVLPVVTWTDGPADTDVDPRIEWRLPGRASQTWPDAATVRLYLDEPDGAPGGPVAPAPTGAAYAGRTDMVARFGADELADVLGLDRGANGVELDTPRMARALADASAEIDASIGNLYALPLAATIPLLRGINCDLARRTLYDEAPTEAVRNDASHARSLLRRLADGTLSLIAEDGSSVERRDDASQAVIVGPDPVFTADALAGL